MVNSPSCAVSLSSASSTGAESTEEGDVFALRRARFKTLDDSLLGEDEFSKIRLDAEEERRFQREALRKRGGSKKRNRNLAADGNEPLGWDISSSEDEGIDEFFRNKKDEHDTVATLNDSNKERSEKCIVAVVDSSSEEEEDRYLEVAMERVEEDPRVKKFRETKESILKANREIFAATKGAQLSAKTGELDDNADEEADDEVLETQERFVPVDHVVSRYLASANDAEDHKPSQNIMAGATVKIKLRFAPHLAVVSGVNQKTRLAECTIPKRKPFREILSSILASFLTDPNINKIVCEIDGEQIEDTDTPEGIDLEGDEIIEVKQSKR